MRLEPRDYEAQVFLVEIYLQQGRLDDAFRRVWKATEASATNLEEVHPALTGAVYRVTHTTLERFGRPFAADLWLVFGSGLWPTDRTERTVRMAVRENWMDEADYYLKKLERVSDDVNHAVWAGRVAQVEGDEAGALNSYWRAYERGSGRTVDEIGVGLWLVQALELFGDSTRADSLSREAVRRHQSVVDGGNNEPGPRLNLAAAHALLGHRDTAYRWLDSAYAAGYRNPEALRHQPVWRTIRDDGRFQELVQRIEEDLKRQHREAKALAQEEGIEWPPTPPGSWSESDTAAAGS